MSKSKSKTQFMGKINNISYESRHRRTDKLEVVANLEIRLKRVDTVKEAEKAIKKLQEALLNKEVVIFAL